MENPKRIYFLDNLRAFMVVLIMLMHVLLVYVSWVYVGWVHDSDPLVAPFAEIISAIMENPILMAPMFFIAGYFTLASFAKKGAKKFVIDKLFRIGIPFAVGATIIAYLLAIISYYSDGGKIFTSFSVPAILLWMMPTLIFFKPGYYTQYHFWSIGVLLWFFLITAWALKTFKKKISPKVTMTGKPSPLFFIWFTLLCTGLTFAVSLAGSFSDWTVVYLISFQNMFIPVYAAYFILGIYAYKRNWFKEGGYSPAMTPWAVIYAASISVHIYLYAIVYKYEISDVIPKLLVAFTYNVTIISWLFLLLAIFRRYFNKGGDQQTMIVKSAYPAYFIHVLILFGMVILTRMMHMAAVAKFIVNLLLVPVFSWVIADDIKNIRILRRIF